MMEKLADQLDEENVRRLLQVCPLSRQLKQDMRDSRHPRDLFKAMMKHGYMEVDDLTMLRKDMITAGISWTAVVQNIPGAYLRQPMIGEADIGPGGGAVEIPHFIKLVVPAGALQHDTEVTVSTVDFPSILIRRTGIHWSSGYPWSRAAAACSPEMLDKVLFSPAFHVNLHGARLTGKVPVEVQTWRPPGTEDHKCIILHHDDMTGWKDISAETNIRVTEDQLVIGLTHCSTIVPIWVPIVLFSSAIAAATAAFTAGGYLVAQILERSKEGTLKCWFSAYMKPTNNPEVQFHVLCKDGWSQEPISYRPGFVHCGDNRSHVYLFNGEYVEVHVKDASGEHEKHEKLTVDTDECRLPWGQQAQLTVPRNQYLIGTVKVKRNKGTQDVCSLTFEQPHSSTSQSERMSPEAGPGGASPRGKRKGKRKGGSGSHVQETSTRPSAKRLRRKEQDVEEATADDLYLKISQNLKDEQVTDLRNYLGSTELLPARDLQRMDPHQMCTKLEQSGKLWKGNPTLLERLMRKVGREDFADQARGIAAKETEGSSDSSESSDD